MSFAQKSTSYLADVELYFDSWQPAVYWDCTFSEAFAIQ